ncbi:MAG: hypothetical protein Tsb004_15740 [Allomuricauda sp.]
MYATSIGAQEAITDKVAGMVIPSKVLGQDREIIFYTTKENPQSKNDYPTLFLLDGKENFLLVSGILSNLVRADVIPNVNLVGINTYDYDREYDLTTADTTEEIGFETGGSAKFQDFIVDEVIPVVEDSLTSSTYRMLVGHSLGGSFALQLVLDRPEVFTSAILIDASVWWNQGELVNTFEKQKMDWKDFVTYISRSGTDPEQIALFDRMKMALGEDQGVFEKFPKENHISVLPPSIFNGLKFIFESYTSLEQLYAKGDFKQIKSKITALSQQFDTSIPPQVRPLAAMARNLTNQGKYKESIAILTYLETAHPRDIMVLNFLGEAYQKNGETDKARKTYKSSLEIAKSKNSPMQRWIEQRFAEVNDK